MKTLVLLLLAMSLSACSGIRHDPAAVAQTSLGTKTTYSYAASDSNYLAVYEAAPAPSKVQVRNQITDELMGLIDDEFEQFARRLHSDHAYKNVFVKVASIALTGAAPFSSSSAAKALAGIDTGLKGANEAVDVEAWGNQAPEILINTMRAERSEVAKEISIMKNESVSTYTLQAAIRDLIRYRNAGYVTSALTALARQTAAHAQAKADDAQKAKIDPAAAKAATLSVR